MVSAAPFGCGQPPASKRHHCPCTFDDSEPKICASAGILQLFRLSLSPRNGDENGKKAQDKNALPKDRLGTRCHGMFNSRRRHVVSYILEFAGIATPL